MTGSSSPSIPFSFTSPKEKITAQIEHMIYPKFPSKLNEFSVIEVKLKGTKERVRVAGHMLPCRRGEWFVFTGRYEQGKKGKQFSFDAVQPYEEGDIGATSCLSRYFGPKTAEKIIAHFSGEAETAYESFQRFPHELAVIKGISKAKVDKALSKYQRDGDIVTHLIEKFKPFGMTVGLAFKIYERYQDRAMEVIFKNPYTLSKDLDYVGFHICDLLSSYYNIPADDNRRLVAGVDYVLKQFHQNGDICVDIFDLKEAAIKLLSARSNIPELYIVKAIESLIHNGDIIVEEYAGQRYGYSRFFYDREVQIAKSLIGISHKTAMDPQQILQAIQEFEQIENITLEQKQREAVMAAMQNRLSIVTGPAGSGKTKIMHCVIYVFEKLKSKKQEKQQGIQIALAAPTGKAAKRLSESTGKPATTIHRLLENKPTENKYSPFVHNKQNPLTHDLIIVDEVSMLDIPLASHLLDAIKRGSHLLLVGDHHQLPSVGPGQFLKDILESGVVPATYLEKVHRLGGEALKRANLVSKGIVPELSNTSDMTFFESNDRDVIYKWLQNTFAPLVKKHGANEVICITPTHKGDFGRIELNRVLQEAVNPQDGTKMEVQIHGETVRVGDRVMQKKNNQEMVNGQIGMVKSYIPADKLMNQEEALELWVDGEVKIIPHRQWSELQLSWADTIHKYQGSEAKFVFMASAPEHRFMTTACLLYTGMTRMKKELFLFGDKQSFAKGVRNRYEKQRTSLLKQRMQGIIRT